MKQISLKTVLTSYWWRHYNYIIKKTYHCALRHQIRSGSGIQLHFSDRNRI